MGFRFPAPLRQQRSHHGTADVQMDMVRAGITLYGLWPSSEMDPSFPLHPAMSLHSHIVAIRDLPEGSAISYGGTFVTERAPEWPPYRWDTGTAMPEAFPTGDTC